VDQEYFEIFTGEFWRMGERIFPPHKALPTQNTT